VALISKVAERGWVPMHQTGNYVNTGEKKQPKVKEFQKVKAPFFLKILTVAPAYLTIPDYDTDILVFYYASFLYASNASFFFCVVLKLMPKFFCFARQNCVFKVVFPGFDFIKKTLSKLHTS